MKLTTTHIVLIVQSVFILILFLVIVFKKKPDPVIVDYTRIKNDITNSISILEAEFDQLTKENIVLYNKLDSLKTQIPNNRKSLNNILNKINELNEAYEYLNYRDSTDEAIIRRLSRGFN
jgi:peptidoglycan hydrolase CwlO-like protein